MAGFSRAPKRQRESGAAVVEFALLVPILLLLVFGIIQYGWYFFAMQTGTSATGDAVRRLSVGDCQDSTQLQGLLSNKLASVKSSGSSVQATVNYANSTAGHSAMSAPGVVGGGVTLRVQFQTTDFHFPFIPVPGGGTVTRTVFARVEDTNSSTGGCS